MFNFYKNKFHSDEHSYVKIYSLAQSMVSFKALQEKYPQILWYPQLYWSFKAALYFHLKF